MIGPAHFSSGGETVNAAGYKLPGNQVRPVNSLRVPCWFESNLEGFVSVFLGGGIGRRIMSGFLKAYEKFMEKERKKHEAFAKRFVDPDGITW